MPKDNDDARVMGIFNAALRLNTEERVAYLQRECGANDALFLEVTEMLQSEDKMDGFMAKPVSLLGEFARPFHVGDVVAGRFEILRHIGEGGMGVVYEALDRKRNQRIAIKAAKFGFRQVLTPEMESALKVRHRNVCLVNEVHTATTQRGDVDFLTMELLEGETLADHLAGIGTLPLAKAVDIARQLCAGLAEAHRAGVIHQDLKPNNVMLCAGFEGSLRVVIMDFGLAGEGAQAGGLAGAPRYLAPELWMGIKASPASDLYALGVILYEMVKGRSPSSEASRPQTLVSREPYWRLTQGCLSLNPEQRRWAFEKAVRADDWRPREWTRRKVFAVAAGGASALVAGVWFERSQLADWMHPLPKKRHVALVAWPAAADSYTKPLVSSSIDAIAAQLSRAEASDRDLLVLKADDHSTSLQSACQPIGANLALALTGGLDAETLRFSMKVIDAQSLKVLRERIIACDVNETPTLASRAVQAAANLLSVRRETISLVALEPPTKSAEAYAAFQAAEQLRAKPNDDGMDAAIESYKRAVDADSQFALAHARLATQYLRLNVVKPGTGALALGEANARRAIQLNPREAEGHKALAGVWEAKGREDEAVAEYRRALALDPDNPRILVWQAGMYEKFNRVQEARDAYVHLKAVRPNYWLAYNNLGALLAEQGEYEEAIDNFRTATLSKPNEWRSFSNLGAMLLKVGRFAEARTQFERSLSIKPMGETYANLSATGFALGDYVQAAAFGRKAVELDQGNDIYWLMLADAYDAMPGMQRQARDAYQKAADDAEQLLRAVSSDRAAWIRLTLYKAKLNLPEEALARVRRFDEFAVSDVDSKLVKARILELLGRRNEALTMLAECLKQGSTPFEIGFTPGLALLRKDAGYARILKATNSPK